MTATDLKPCPFCGGEAQAFETEVNSEYCAQAQCKGCGAEIVFWLPWTAGYGQRASAMVDVAARWNARRPTADDTSTTPLQSDPQA